MKPVDINEVRAYLETCGPGTKLYFGADSERFRVDGVWYSDCSVVLVVHRESCHGAKIFGEIFRERDFDKDKSKPRLRLMNEAYKLAEFFKRFEDLPYEFGFDFEIHLDISPDPKNGSNIVIQEAVGYIKGMCNVTPLTKNDAWASSFAADRFKSLKQA
jgi:predicted RNase H-related nuclease YkuK (DUF458 family)